MKQLFLLLIWLLPFILKAQELYVFTEPASNMPAKSLGIRINSELMPATNMITHNSSYRFNPELMWGINKRWMLHLNGYFSNIHQVNFNPEGTSIYIKYRFLSIDHVQSHFRIAAYAKTSFIDNPIKYNDINLSGDNSGYTAGLIATQLLHKLALSVTAGHIKGINNKSDNYIAGQPTQAYNYSLSAGYLLFPKIYKNYNQPNLNIYVELLGKTNPQTAENYMDIAPAIQVIIKSRLRIDMGYRKQLIGNMFRMSEESFVVKFEYNLFNIY